MEFLKNMFGDPVPTGVNLILLTLMLVLILSLLFWIFRKFVGTPSIKQVRGRQPRLAVTDAANLDDKRRLVLVRRDDVEHLVMIGGATDVLIESNIVRAAPGRSALTQKPLIAENQQQEDNTENSSTATAAIGAVGLGAIAAVAISENDTADANDDPVSTEPTAVEQVAADTKSELDSSQVDIAQEEIVEPAVEELSAPDVSPQEVEVPSPDNAQNIQTIEMDAMVSLEDALGEELSDIDALDKPEPAPDVESNISDAEIDTDNKVPEPAIDLPEENSESSSTANEQPEPNMEDEMQKLLDELSGEKI